MRTILFFLLFCSTSFGVAPSLISQGQSWLHAADAERVYHLGGTPFSVSDTKWNPTNKVASTANSAYITATADPSLYNVGNTQIDAKAVTFHSYTPVDKIQVGYLYYPIAVAGDFNKSPVQSLNVSSSNFKHTVKLHNPDEPTKDKIVNVSAKFYVNLLLGPNDSPLTPPFPEFNQEFRVHVDAYNYLDVSYERNLGAGNNKSGWLLEGVITDVYGVPQTHYQEVSTGDGPRSVPNLNKTLVFHPIVRHNQTFTVTVTQNGGDPANANSWSNKGHNPERSYTQSPNAYGDWQNVGHATVNFGAITNIVP